MAVNKHIMIFISRFIFQGATTYFGSVFQDGLERVTISGNKQVFYRLEFQHGINSFNHPALFFNLIFCLFSD